MILYQTVNSRSFRDQNNKLKEVVACDLEIPKKNFFYYFIETLVTIHLI